MKLDVLFVRHLGQTVSNSLSSSSAISPAAVSGLAIQSGGNAALHLKMASFLVE